MAHSLSAKKRIRQNEKRRLANKSKRTALKTRIRWVRDAIRQQRLEDAERAFREACKLLDRYAAQRLIHPNTAARKKSRLARRLAALTQQTG